MSEAGGTEALSSSSSYVRDNAVSRRRCDPGNPESNIFFLHDSVVGDMSLAQHGVASSAVLPRGRRGAPLRAGGGEAPHIAAAPEPTDSAPRDRIAGATLPPDDTSRRADKCRSNVSRRSPSRGRARRTGRRNGATGDSWG